MHLLSHKCFHLYTEAGGNYKIIITEISVCNFARIDSENFTDVTVFLIFNSLTDEFLLHLLLNLCVFKVNLILILCP